MELWRCTFYVAFLLLSLQVVYGRHPPSMRPDPSQQMKHFSADPVSIVCLLEHCSKSSFECGLNSDCRDAIACAEKCWGNWDNDTTPEKFHVQNCTEKCALTYDSKEYDSFMTCITDNKCMSFPPIPNTCRGKNVHPVKSLSVKDIQGEWWALRGYHPVYDCFPCQHLSFEPMSMNTWNYTTRYQAYLIDGSLKFVIQHMVMPNSPPGTNITFVYHDKGVETTQIWWLIDKADDGSYVLMYYCGYALQWNYEGALVLAQNRTLSEDVYANIRATYQKTVGLDFNSFCDINTSTSCPD